MTHIEGITPSKKHKTVEQKRGKYSHFDSLEKKARNQQQHMLVIAGVTLLVLFAGWFFMLQKGYLFSNSSSDTEFVNTIAEEFSEADAKGTLLTPAEDDVYTEVEKDVFPQFTN